MTTFMSRLAMLRDVVKKGGLIMGVDIGKKYTGTVFLDLWSSELTYSLVKMQQKQKPKSPDEIANILQKLVINNGVNCMVVGHHNGYPSRDGIENDLVSMVADIAWTRALSFLPFLFEHEFGSSEWAEEKLKTESKQMQQRQGGKHLLSAERIVCLYLAECRLADSLEDFKTEHSAYAR